MSDEQTVQLAVIRERESGKVRCIYLGQFRVYGSKPYVSEHLPHEFFEIPISAVEAAVRFEKKFPQTEAPKKFEQPDNRTNPSVEEDQQTPEET